MPSSFLIGGWPDVCAVPAGVAIVNIQHQTEVVASVNMIEAWRVTCSGHPRWLRCAANPGTGEVRAIVTQNTSPSTDEAFLITSAGEVPLGVTIRGERAVALTWESTEFVAYICDTRYTYRRWPNPPTGVLSAPIANPFPTTGTPIGMLQVTGGVPVWAQSLTSATYAFTTIGGQDFYFYNTAGAVTVGQLKGPPETSEGLIASPDGSAVVTLTAIKCFDPHVALITAGPFAGQAVVVARSVDVTFRDAQTGQTVTGNTFVNTDLTAGSGSGLANIFAPIYRVPMVEKSGIVSEPWWKAFQALGNLLATPIDLGSNEVTGILPASNLPFDWEFLLDDFGVLTGLIGDVVATGPGIATATIQPNVVTFAKFQQIATQRVVGRDTAGTGNTEEVTATQVLDWIGATRGAVLYRGASGWALLAPGTAGDVLTSNGAGADPSYQPGSSVSADYVLLGNGAQPPTPIDDGAGQFIYTAYTP